MMGRNGTQENLLQKDKDSGKQQTVVAWAMDRIRDLITSKEYKPGDKIPTELELAESLGIGRSSIREAIKIFSHLGVLESRVPKGTFLCNRSKISSEAILWSIFLGADDMWDTMELRFIIEEKAFKSMMSRFKENREGLPPFIRKLEDEVKIMQSAARGRKIEELMRADYTFHDNIVREGGNALFFSLFETLHSFSQEVIRRTYQAKADLQTIPREHKLLIEAIRTGDTKAAEAFYIAHFPHIHNRVLPKI